MIIFRLKKPPQIVEMAANGQLVFTDVDKVTFKGVGNASNAVIDTTTGKIGVGVDSPDANLHVLGNCFVSTNFELGGTMTMGTVTVRAQHELSAITATGNTTPHTVEFQNAETSLVTTANVEVGGELTVAGNVAVDTDTLFVDSVNDRVGIGTTDPDKKLHIYTVAGEGNTQLHLESESRYSTIQMLDDNGAILFGNDRGDFRFITGYDTSILGGSEAMRIKGSGNVGIGKTDPATALDVLGTIRVQTGTNDETGGEFSIDTNVGHIRRKVDGNGVSLTSYDDFQFYVNATGGSAEGGTQAMIIDNSGNVGIGTASPAKKLHVEHYGSAIGDFEGIRIANHATNLHASSRPAYEFVVSDIDAGTGLGNGKFAIGYRDTTSASRTDRLVIDNSGNVGIGTTSPSTDLQIGNTSTKTSDTYLTIASDGGSAYAQGIRLIHHGTDTSSMFGWRIRGDDTDDCFHVNYINSGSQQTSALTINNNGIITTPKRPAFYAWDNSTSRSGTTLTFDSTTYNIGSHYNTATSRFKTPVAGTYIFAAVLAHDTANEFGDAYFSFYVDGVNARDILEGMPIHDSHYETHAVFIVNLNANQYVDIRSRSSTDITFINGHHGAYYRNCFQGALLG